MTSIVKGAVFASEKNSNKNEYRYQLWRIWDEEKPIVMFIGLNPSDGDCKADDKTIGRLMNFSTKWGFGGFYVGNLFGFVTPDPKELKQSKNPIGSANDKHLKEMSGKCDKIVCIWGNDGILLGRNKEVMNMFPNLYCLEKSKENHPKHPLYLRADLTLIEYKIT